MNYLKIAVRSNVQSSVPSYYNIISILLSSGTSMSRLTVVVLLVLSSCSWTPAGGQRCSFTGRKIHSECTQLLMFHA